MIRLEMVAFERGDYAKIIERQDASTGCNVTLPPQFYIT